MQNASPWTAAVDRGLPDDGLLVVCSTADQSARLWAAGAPVARYPVSTSARGVGCVKDSLQTPLGWHCVRERIGQGQPAGTVFRDRQPTGEVLPPSAWRSGARDLILSRILWLDGLEPGQNRGDDCDSHARFIYLHGTNREDLLGQPASRGCIRFGNLAICELFDHVADRETWCLITDQAE